MLTAAPATREIAHRVRVELAPGRARVQVELEFEARGDKPGELRYRLAVPLGARLTSLEVCNAAGCRPGAVADSDSALRAYAADVLARPAARGRALPIAHAEDVRDATRRGDFRARGAASKRRTATAARGLSRPGRS